MDNLDNLVYLDLEFISRKFEEITGTDPSTKINKQGGSKAEFKALFANAGISTQESRTYSITSREMLRDLWKHLTSHYDQFAGFENNKGTRTVWVEGHLTLGYWEEENTDKPAYEYFELIHKGERIALLTDETYLAAGFSKVLSASPALKGNIYIPVKCLVRIMWHYTIAENYVACPYVIVEHS